MKIDWSKTHCGVYHCPIVEAIKLQPELTEPLFNLIQSGGLEFPYDYYLVDSKVCMLMPGQFPCIPNWHFDFIPRDSNLKEIPELKTTHKMYLWLSGKPFTEFKDGRKIEENKWVSFTQDDEHRGTASESFLWRCFIRVTPKSLMTDCEPNQWLRRHSQVYLDSNNFKW